MPILKKNQLYNIFPLFTNIFTNAPGLIFCLSYAAVSSIVATYAHDSGCTSALMDRQTAATADSIDVAITPGGPSFSSCFSLFSPTFQLCRYLPGFPAACRVLRDGRPYSLHSAPSGVSVSARQLWAYATASRPIAPA